MNKNNFAPTQRVGLNKTRLAQAYFPYVSEGTARRNLLRWITMNPELQRRLDATGYQKSQRCFTPAQVDIIYDVLGEP